jgi:catechol 2,3-dioxygenase-like lactoylglutathione lyase family enzyme
MNPIRAIVECGIYADDLLAATEFYRDVLGLELSWIEEDRHAFFRVGDSMLLVFKPAATLKGDILPAHGASGPGHFALGIDRDQLEPWRQRLAEFGVAIEKEMDWPLGGKSIYFRDPAGNSVELVTQGLWNLPSGW